ncbi:D-alanyl-D-alanine carboxypeptidase family protein [Streptomyces acidiscabies]|uniref:D-alanyl-D-alanine carboxypeptidase family protein n=1 Tax=Streptomyces acidiscabies TaxID=42234 RepID=UPI000288D7FD|nr:serine hydrolase [Streptomyces acidiscabies]MBP5940016.1 D-alanyl-D-alanine carboxypeptidase [Streptomyces sp. LBUM 1476]MBZ3911208.1 D-alanyl-D-alanine carboxypeptidase [Streptomyces acidiscabies]
MNISARAWIVADHESGEVLAAHNPHTRLAPASTLKMLFADTLLGKFARTERHTVRGTELATVPEGSSLVGIKAGVTYTVEDLWHGVFLRSGNDAVRVLAAMNGGIDRTVTEMRAKAADLQAVNTYVVSPDGYDHPRQYSSAYDLTLMARSGLRNADFRTYCGTRTARIGKTGIENTNRLLCGSHGVKPYAGMIGVKNGYTSNAGNTFVGAATRNGRTLLAAVLHPKSGLNAVYEETRTLLDWGFTQGSSAKTGVTLAEPLSEGGAKVSHNSPHGAAGSAGTAVDDDSVGWGLPVGGAVAGALLGGVYVLRNRRTKKAVPQEG